MDARLDVYSNAIAGQFAKQIRPGGPFGEVGA
jgi:hypothetical protein